MAQPLQLSNLLASSLLEEMHVERRREMLARFLTALDIPNDDGIAGRLGDHDPGEAVVHEAAEDLAREHGLRRVMVYFFSLAVWRVPFADHLWSWMTDARRRSEPESEPESESGPELESRPEFEIAHPEPAASVPQPAVQPIAPMPAGEEPESVVAPESDEPAGEEVLDSVAGPESEEALESVADPETSGAAEPDESAAESLDGGSRSQEDSGRDQSLRTLDRLLIEALVDSRQGVEGSLDEDAVDDAVDEFVNLNGRRQQSYFHAGFRDVLFSKTLARELPGENRTRARWYWAGVILGWTRLESWSRIVAAYDGNPVVRSLGDGADFAAHEAARHVVRALMQEGRSSELTDFVQVGGLRQSFLLSPPPVESALFRQTLDAGTGLLRTGDVGAARTIFDRLMETVRALEGVGFEPASPLFLTVRRRRAHCLQRLLEHDWARGLLEELLELDPEPRHRAMVHADLGLLAGRFNSLGDVSLPPKENELTDFVDRLAEGRAHFQQAVNRDVRYSAHGHYCLGLLALGEKRLARTEVSYARAENHLARVQGQFTSPSENYDESLVARANLYFGMARAARAGSAGDLTHAAKVMVGALDAGASFPSYMVEPVVEGLDLGARADLSHFARILLDTHGDAALEALARNQAVVGHCREVTDALRARADRHGRSEASAKDLRTCLPVYLRTGSSEDAEEILDQLESMAVNGIGVAEFDDLLSSPEGYQPVWDPEEVVIARARCMEARGELLPALRVLRPLVHQYATVGDREDASGVLDRIRGYGLPAEYYSQESSRVEALEDPAEDQEPVAAGAPRTIIRRAANVLVVGGDELQRKMASAVRAKVARRAPNVEMTFIYSGWSGNWRQHLDKVRAEMPKHDAVVVMRFMRTELGKHVRKQCGGTPWRSCWPSGQKGMADAILAAAEAAWGAG